MSRPGCQHRDARGAIEGSDSVPVVVVTHLGPSPLLTRCVAALQRAGSAGPIVVVDNGSCERGPVPTNEEYGPGPIEVVHTTNRGFGAAANLGFRHASKCVADQTSMVPSAIALLNDDVEVTDQWLLPLVTALGGTCGAVQPKLMLTDERFVAAGSDAPAAGGARDVGGVRGVDSDHHVNGAHRVNSVGVRCDEYGAGSDIGYGQPDGPGFMEGRDIDMFTGGAVLFGSSFLDATGGFDERYFMYYEDVDLALRGRDLGWTYRCEPSSVVWHESGGSSAALGDDLRRLQDRNRVWIALRFGTLRAVSKALELSVRRLRHAPRRAHARALTGAIGAAPRLLWERRRARPGIRTECQR